MNIKSKSLSLRTQFEDYSSSNYELKAIPARRPPRPYHHVQDSEPDHEDNNDAWLGGPVEEVTEEVAEVGSVADEEDGDGDERGADQDELWSLAESPFPAAKRTWCMGSSNLSRVTKATSISRLTAHSKPELVNLQGLFIPPPPTSATSSATPSTGPLSHAPSPSSWSGSESWTWWWGWGGRRAVGRRRRRRWRWRMEWNQCRRSCQGTWVSKTTKSSTDKRRDAFLTVSLAAPDSPAFVFSAKSFDVLSMEITSFTLFSSQTFSVALAFTFLSLLLAVRSRSSKPWRSQSDGGSSSTENDKLCNCLCYCNGVVTGSEPVEVPHLNGETEKKTAVAEAEATGASMMEQLVPEITTHALSYLDYPSLCRLSMTNSLMRKAANDDNAWKALYHKDFTSEQDSVTPVNGWKAYYAATRAIVNVNVRFFNFIRDRSLPEMSHLWLNADYVKCVHPSGEFFSGYNAVVQSWQLAFNWEQGVNFQVRDVRARVLTDMAWVTMKTYVGDHLDTGPFSVTNIFEFHNGRWYMVHHHSSVLDEVEHQNA
ncbi:hypothetical protein ACLB2K_048506 [Fragaria x ananassa]